jgi:hypothetical protein
MMDTTDTFELVQNRYDGLIRRRRYEPVNLVQFQLEMVLMGANYSEHFGPHPRTQHSASHSDHLKHSRSSRCRNPHVSRCRLKVLPGGWGDEGGDFMALRAAGCGQQSGCFHTELGTRAGCYREGASPTPSPPREGASPTPSTPP